MHTIIPLSISVITKGKYAVLEAAALDKLVPLLSDFNSEVRLNSIKALTLLAETPKAKQELQTCLPKVSTNPYYMCNNGNRTYSLCTVCMVCR